MFGVYPAAQHHSAIATKKNVLRLRFMQILLATTLCCTSSICSELAVAQNLPTLGDTAREELSPLAERKLGEQIMNVVRRDPDYIDDGPVSEYLNRLGDKLLDASPDARGEQRYDFEFFAVRDPVLNAFAFPGGFIGFHSGLILASQSESELASVMGHEIGHVAQRHIARMLSSQKYDALIPLAALALAVLASRSSPDAAIALAAGGQGLAIQKQLNFSREAEREADRIGFQILRDSGFDANGMVSFFGRLQASTRNYNDNVPAYLRSHPLTSERIADIQTRVLDQRYKQISDSLDFFLMKARIRVLQDPTVQGLLDSKLAFDLQMKSERAEDRIAAKYGLAFIALKQLDYLKADSLYSDVKKQVEKNPVLQPILTRSSVFSSLSIDIAIAEKKYDYAIREAEKSIEQLPLSRGLVYQYVEALLAAQKVGQAESYLRDQLVLYRQDAKLQNLLAKVYEIQGKQALQHIALAEAYAIQANWRAAMQQLNIARREKDAQYYEQSVIDAREREWSVLHKEELVDEKRKR